MALLVGSARLHLFRREPRVAAERHEALIELCKANDIPLFQISSGVEDGWLLLQQGRYEEAIAHIRRGCDMWQAVGMNFHRSQWMTLLAELHGEIGQFEEGLSAITEALSHVESTDERYWEAEVHRIKGELLRMKGADEAEVERHFLHALEVARRQGAKSLELRATMSLCRLWQGQGKVADAREMLTEIYNWFTEGFDTGDLMEAKALLEELSGESD